MENEDRKKLLKGAGILLFAFFPVLLLFFLFPLMFGIEIPWGILLPAIFYIIAYVIISDFKFFRLDNEVGFWQFWIVNLSLMLILILFCTPIVMFISGAFFFSIESFFLPEQIYFFPKELINGIEFGIISMLFFVRWLGYLEEIQLENSFLEVYRSDISKMPWIMPILHSSFGSIIRKTILLLKSAISDILIGFLVLFALISYLIILPSSDKLPYPINIMDILPIIFILLLIELCSVFLTDKYLLIEKIESEKSDEKETNIKVKSKTVILLKNTIINFKNGLDGVFTKYPELNFVKGKTFKKVMVILGILFCSLFIILFFSYLGEVAERNQEIIPYNISINAQKESPMTSEIVKSDNKLRILELSDGSKVPIFEFDKNEPYSDLGINETGMFLSLSNLSKSDLTISLDIYATEKPRLNFKPNFFGCSKSNHEAICYYHLLQYNYTNITTFCFNSSCRFTKVIFGQTTTSFTLISLTSIDHKFGCGTQYVSGTTLYTNDSHLFSPLRKSLWAEGEKSVTFNNQSSLENALHLEICSYLFYIDNSQRTICK